MPQSTFEASNDEIHVRYQSGNMSADELLRRYRLENNLTQQHMANLLGVSQAAYHKWESEITKIPLDRYLSISVVCNVKLQDMLPDNWQKKINSE